jgi:large-conductance mechanosensitive channel
MDNLIQIESDNKIEIPDSKLKAIVMKFRSDFQEFAFTNKFIASCVGISIGIATKEYIQNILNKIVLPILYKIGKILFSHRIYQMFAPYHTIINFSSELIWDTINWIILIVLTFIILEYVLNRKILGLKNAIAPEEEVKFLKAKKDAMKKSIIIPDDDEILELKQKEAAEKNETHNIFSTSPLLQTNTNIFKLPDIKDNLVKNTKSIETFPTGILPLPVNTSSGFPTSLFG